MSNIFIVISPDPTHNSSPLHVCLSAQLCHTEPAWAMGIHHLLGALETISPLGAFLALVLYGIRAPLIDPCAIKNQPKAKHRLTSTN